LFSRTFGVFSLLLNWKRRRVRSRIVIVGLFYFLVGCRKSFEYHRFLVLWRCYLLCSHLSGADVRVLFHFFEATGVIEESKEYEFYIPDLCHCKHANSDDVYRHTYRKLKSLQDSRRSTKQRRARQSQISKNVRILICLYSQNIPVYFELFKL